MTEQEIDALVANYIPEWAVRKACGVLEIGTQLPTKDGRRFGNGHIIDIEHRSIGRHAHVYTVLTDAGNRIKLTAVEIEQCFHEPQWIADIGEVIVKFSRQ